MIGFIALFVFIVSAFLLSAYFQSKTSNDLLDDDKFEVLLPKYAKVGILIKYLGYSLVAMIAIILLYSQLETDCQEIWGLSIGYLSFLGLYLLLFIYILFTLSMCWQFLQVYIHKGDYYPRLQDSPLFFKRKRVLVNEEYYKEQKNNFMSSFFKELIFLAVLGVGLHITTSDKPIFPVSEANEAYQQACIAELKEKRP